MFLEELVIRADSSKGRTDGSRFRTARSIFIQLSLAASQFGVWRGICRLHLDLPDISAASAGWGSDLPAIAADASRSNQNRSVACPIPTTGGGKHYAVSFLACRISSRPVEAKRVSGAATKCQASEYDVLPS